MSIKEGFDGNNVDIQTAIDVVNALEPDSGPEGYAVTISLGTFGNVHYTDPSGVYHNVITSGLTAPIVVMKNSLVFVEATEPQGAAPSVSANGTILYTTTGYGIVIQVSGDCTVGGE